MQIQPHGKHYEFQLTQTSRKTNFEHVTFLNTTDYNTSALYVITQNDFADFIIFI